MHAGKNTYTHKYKYHLIVKTTGTDLFGLLCCQFLRGAYSYSLCTGLNQMHLTYISFVTQVGLWALRTYTKHLPNFHLSRQLCTILSADSRCLLNREVETLNSAASLLHPFCSGAPCPTVRPFFCLSSLFYAHSLQPKLIICGKGPSPSGFHLTLSTSLHKSTFHLLPILEKKKKPPYLETNIRKITSSAANWIGEVEEKDKTDQLTLKRKLSERRSHWQSSTPRRQMFKLNSIHTTPKTGDFETFYK